MRIGELQFKKISALLLLLVALIFTLIFSNSKSFSKFTSESNFNFNVSHKSGFYSSPINVSIASTDNFAIRYSLDGKEPSKNSPEYDIPIKIHSSAVLKFKFFDKFDNAQSKSFSYHYIFSSHNKIVFSLSIEPDHLFNYKNGIYVSGEDKSYVNYRMRGKEWVRKGEISIFEKENLIANLPVEIRIHGGATRDNPQKSLRICADKSRGHEFFNYHFFETHKNWQTKCIILRAGGNDWDKTLIRDNLGQEIATEMGLVTQNRKPSVLYINGDYYGIYTITEFHDFYFFKNRYSIKRESFSLVEPDRRDNGYGILKEGTETSLENYNYLIENKDNLKIIEESIDIKDYLDYFILNIYLANGDWPDNNIRVWRFNADNYQGYNFNPLDGKWRYLVYDLDSTSNLFRSSSYQFNSLEPVLSSNFRSSFTKKDEEWPAAFFITILKDQNYKEYFINRFAYHLNNSLSSKTFLEKLNKTKELYTNEISNHSKRWGGMLDKGRKPAFKDLYRWEVNINSIAKFGENREFFVKQHIISTFNLGGIFTIKIVTENDIQGGEISINNEPIKLNDNTKLIYFQNNPVYIEAKPNFGYKFIGWGNNKFSNENKIKSISTLEEEVEIKPSFKKEWWAYLLIWIK